MPLGPPQLSRSIFRYNNKWKVKESNHMVIIYLCEVILTPATSDPWQNLPRSQFLPFKLYSIMLMTILKTFSDSDFLYLQTVAQTFTMFKCSCKICRTVSCQCYHFYHKSSVTLNNLVNLFNIFRSF